MSSTGVMTCPTTDSSQPDITLMGWPPTFFHLFMPQSSLLVSLLLLCHPALGHLVCPVIVCRLLHTSVPPAAAAPPLLLCLLPSLFPPQFVSLISFLILFLFHSKSASLFCNFFLLHFMHSQFEECTFGFRTSRIWLRVLSSDETHF